MVRFSILAAAAVFLAVIGVQVYRLRVQRAELEARAEKIESEVELLASENARVEEDLQYYANTENLMKEFRSLFNYREPEEELHIIIPRERRGEAP